MNPGAKIKIGLVITLLNLSFISCCPFIKTDDPGHHLFYQNMIMLTGKSRISVQVRVLKPFLLQ